MLERQAQPISNSFPGNYSGNNTWLGNQFNATNIIIHFWSERTQSRLFIPFSTSMTTPGVDVVETLDLKDAQGNDMIGNVQEAIFNARNQLSRLPNPQPLLYQLEIAHQGFRNWISTLSAFGGSEEQRSQMIFRRAAVMEALKEVFTMAERVSNTTTRLAPREVSDLIESVGILINVFPEARQQHLNNINLDEAEPQPYYLNPGPTMSEPPQSPPAASRAGTRRTTTTTSDPYYRNKIEKVMSDDYSRMIAGDWVRDPVVYAQATQGKGNWYMGITARGHSSLIAGNVYGGPSPYPNEQPDVEAQEMPTAADPPRRGTNRTKRKESMK